MERLEFAAFLKALDDIPDLGEKRYADRSFFAAAPACFFREYCRMFVKHVSTAAISSEILIYMLSGDPHLA